VIGVAEDVLLKILKELYGRDVEVSVGGSAIYGKVAKFDVNSDGGPFIVVYSGKARYLVNLRNVQYVRWVAKEKRLKGFVDKGFAEGRT